MSVLVEELLEEEEEEEEVREITLIIVTTLPLPLCSCSTLAMLDPLGKARSTSSFLGY